MLGPVGFHVIFHRLLNLALIIGQLHIDKVYHNNPPNIPQTKLTGNFFGGFQIGLQGIFFLIVTYAFIATVYVYHMQGLGMLNN